MILNTVMNEIGTRLDTIAGLRIYDFPADQIAAPAAVIAYPDSITYDQTYGRGMDRIVLPVLVMVGRVSDRASRDKLAAYADGSGAGSIKAVIEGGTYTSFHTVRVVSAEFDVVRVGTVDYAAALFDLDITGSGS